MLQTVRAYLEHRPQIKPGFGGSKGLPALQVCVCSTATLHAAHGRGVACAVRFAHVTHSPGDSVTFDGCVMVSHVNMDYVRGLNHSPNQ